MLRECLLLGEIHSSHGKLTGGFECHSKPSGQQIHHALCGHGGERCVIIGKNKIFVDGFDAETSTIYQFYRCKWHGCPLHGNSQ